MEEVPGAVARDLVEGFPRGALVGVGEQGFDPRRKRISALRDQPTPAAMRASGPAAISFRPARKRTTGAAEGAAANSAAIQYGGPPPLFRLTGSMGPSGPRSKTETLKASDSKAARTRTGPPGRGSRGETRTALGPEGAGASSGGSGMAGRSDPPAAGIRETRQRTAPADRKERSVLNGVRRIRNNT